MRAVFGIVSLLVVLAIVAVLAKKQLQAVNSAVATVAPAASGGTVVEQSRQLQQQVKANVAKALEQGAAAARKDEADK
jgi:hypothetical protein